MGYLVYGLWLVPILVPRNCLLLVKRRMAWRSHGKDNNDLVDHLFQNDIIKSKEVSVKVRKQVTNYNYDLFSKLNYIGSNKKITIIID